MTELTFTDLDNHFDQASALLSHMGNSHRLRVLMILSHEEVAVNELAGKVGLTQSALSQHLTKLRQGKLVKRRRESQKIYYSCTSPAVFKLLTALDELYRKPNESTAKAV